MKHLCLLLALAAMFAASLACGSSGGDSPILPPEGLSVTVVDDSTVQLSWTSAGEDFTYIVRLFADGGTEPLYSWNAGAVSTFNAVYEYSYESSYFFNVSSVVNGEESETTSSSSTIVPFDETPCWAITVGGSSSDDLSDSAIMTDGSLVSVGQSSIDGDFQGLLVKTDSTGSIVWQKSLGGTGQDTLLAVTPCSDGGCVAVGRIAQGENPRAWALKLDSSGAKVWEKMYGAAGFDVFNSVVEVSDGYVMCGMTGSLGTSFYISWIVKLSLDGELSWHREYGISSPTNLNSIASTSDGGFIVAGYTLSHAMMMKLDSTGSIEWCKLYSCGYSTFNSVIVTSDGDYVATGYSSALGTHDGWIARISTTGELTSSMGITGSGYEVFYDVAEDSDGGFYLTGISNTDSTTGYDSCLAHFSSDFSSFWYQTYGGSLSDMCMAVNVSDDGFVYTSINSNSYGQGGNDFFLVKSFADGTLGGSSCPVITSEVQLTTREILCTPVISNPTGYSAPFTPSDPNSTAYDTAMILLSLYPE